MTVPLQTVLEKLGLLGFKRGGGEPGMKMAKCLQKKRHQLLACFTIVLLVLIQLMLDQVANFSVLDASLEVISHTNEDL